jgi:hypothetical protein
MTTSRYYRVTNSMLFSILISNGIGVAVVHFLTQRSASAISPAILGLVEDINHNGSATEILGAILSTLDKFQEGAKKEDDVTLVVIKMQEDR